MKAGDKIRVQYFMGRHPIETVDLTVEEFRHCLGVFETPQHRQAQKFTPLCELYEPAPNAKLGYIPNFGEYYDNYVPTFMNIPKD